MVIGIVYLLGCFYDTNCSSCTINSDHCTICTMFKLGLKNHQNSTFFNAQFPHSGVFHQLNILNCSIYSAHQPATHCEKMYVITSYHFCDISHFFKLNYTNALKICFIYLLEIQEACFLMNAPHPTIPWGNRIQCHQWGLEGKSIYQPMSRVGKP